MKLDFTKPPPSHTAICPLPRFQFPLRAFSLLSEHHKVSALLQAKRSSPRLKALAQRREDFWSRSQFYYWHPETSAYSMSPFCSGAVLSPSRHWILGSLPAFRVSHIPPAAVLLPNILSRAGGEGRGQAACHHNSPCFCRKICSVEEPCCISPTSEIVFSFQLMMTYIISRSLEHQRFFLRQRRKAKHNSPAVRASKDKAKCCFPGVSFSSRASSSHPKSVGAAWIPLGRPPDPAQNNRLVKDHLHGGGRGESWEHQPSSHGQQMRHVQPLCTWL